MAAANNWDVYTDADALLPPRKRLLAGMKRQSVNLPASSIFQSVDTEYEAHLNSLLKVRLSDPSLSNDEIVEISRSAAIEAVNTAQAARAKAEIKALKAVSAMAAAKSALDLVATLSCKEKNVRKGRMKKQVTVETLYDKNNGNNNSTANGELARKLNQAITNSPRIFKNASDSDAKKHKKLKTSAVILSEVAEADQNCAAQDATDGLSSVKVNLEAQLNMVDLSTEKTNVEGATSLVDQEQQLTHNAHSKLENGMSIDKSTESLDKKRGRLKQKKLPLSICSFRDQTNHRDELKPQTTQQSEDNTLKEPSSPLDTLAETSVAVKETATWKCKAFKVATQNKVHL